MHFSVFSRPIYWYYLQFFTTCVAPVYPGLELELEECIAPVRDTVLADRVVLGSAFEVALTWKPEPHEDGALCDTFLGKVSFCALGATYMSRARNYSLCDYFRCTPLLGSILITVLCLFSTPPLTISLYWEAHSRWHSSGNPSLARTVLM